MRRKLFREKERYISAAFPKLWHLLGFLKYNAQNIIYYHCSCSPFLQKITKFLTSRNLFCTSFDIISWIFCKQTDIYFSSFLYLQNFLQKNILDIYLFRIYSFYLFIYTLFNVDNFLMLTIYNYNYKKIKQLCIIFCILNHVNYNKNKINYAHLQHKQK